ncbi:MAG: hypothetical protein ACLFT0_17115, partial [Spirulinaceae cyanobacterium]
TNNQQPTTNNQQPTTNDKRQSVPKIELKFGQTLYGKGKYTLDVLKFIEVIQSLSSAQTYNV